MCKPGKKDKKRRKLKGKQSKIQMGAQASAVPEQN
jgi:hypothetical protein